VCVVLYRFVYEYMFAMLIAACCYSLHFLINAVHYIPQGKHAATHP
jgi:hypothetical protein